MLVCAITATWTEATKKQLKTSLTLE